MKMIGFLLVALLASPAHATDSVRCGNHLVAAGDTALELRARCGPPAHVASRPVLTTQVRVGGSGPSDVSYTQEIIETWTYGAPNQLTRLATIRRGRVERIREGGYRDAAPGCLPANLRPGAAVGEVFLRCGSPQDGSRWIEEQAEGSGLSRRLIVHDRWVYDPGPGRLLRIFEFVNGVLVSTQTGGRSVADGSSYSAGGSSL